MTALRWTIAGEEPQQALFSDEELVERHVGRGEFAGLEFLHVNAKTILNEVKGSAMPFRWTVNAYRGCSHACTYCFARPTHEHLALDAGDDFNRKIVVKVNAVERLAAEMRAPKWKGEHIAIGTNTDPYQRAEGKYHLYQGMLKVLTERANPFSILTKSTLVLRDLPLLQAAAERTTVRVNLSIGSLDEDVWKAFEPGTPHPRQRMEAVRKLNEAGIETGVLMGPVIPGLSDDEDHIREVVEAAHAAGAVSISAIALHLRAGVRPWFFEKLQESHPHLVADFERRYAGGANLPKDVQKAVSDRVRRAVQSVERRSGRARQHSAADDPGGIRAIDTADRNLARIAVEQGHAVAPTSDPATATAPDGVQLSLFA